VFLRVVAAAFVLLATASAQADPALDHAKAVLAK
jgi:hypothetical protein